ncbi:hypothetical protein RND71_028999 [Anisodus tanguticus]|uniref:Phosphoribosylformimino-5-aminoimidazole carboxamide ribotide isomerase n=1 Tax=Anisodus tanguticus TaxID=243964 RepID=A0AAE1RM09_9SOLA|nr:hypothetical protein RND71_028999 [Anisodus tanguticus]
MLCSHKLQFFCKKMEVMGSSRGNSLLQKCRIRLRTKDPCGPEKPDPTHSGSLVHRAVLYYAVFESHLIEAKLTLTMQSLQATSASSLQNLSWGKNLSYASCTLNRTQDFIPVMTSPPFAQRLSIQCGVRFRPCIDVHKGKVKQIVGSTLRDSKEADTSLVTNFESDKSAGEYAKLYRDDCLVGSHVIMLGADPLSMAAATEALHAYPGKCMSLIMDLERLKELASLVGRKSLEGEYLIVTDRWQKFSDIHLNEKVLNILAEYADEFLVHGVDVEGKKLGVDVELVALLGKYSPIPVTYAGGVTVMADLEKIKVAGMGRVDVTVGSALDIFGGNLASKDVVAWHALQDSLAV